MEKCFKCGKPLSADEIGLHKKLINRGAEKFMCIECLSNFYNCSTELLYKKIEQFRLAGCTLFENKQN